MKPLVLTLLTPQGLVFEGEVLEAYFPTVEGPLGVLPGHTPFIAQIAPSGVIALKDARGFSLYFAVHQGAVEIRPDKTIALLESCVKMTSKEDAIAYLKKEEAFPKGGEKDIERAEAALASQYAKSGTK
jgi:F-type H+-transporting ATPase subunit epsilon